MRIRSLILASAVLLVACQPAATVDPTDETTASTTLTLTWDISNPQTDETDRTTADVALVLSDADGAVVERIPLGTYAGCGMDEVPGDGPLLTLKCWWAGAGDDFQVRMEGIDTLTVDHRSIDEQAEIPEFAPLKSVTIPTDALLNPVATLN